MTGKVVVSEFVSIDGVMEPAGRDGYPHGAWTMPYRPADLGECAAAALLAAGALLLGRATYQGSPTTWPTGHESTIVRGEMRAAVQARKDRQGADALVVGGATLVHGLLAAGLVDELRLEVYPVALGVGTRPAGVATRLDFEVAESTQTSAGVMLVIYRCTRASAENVA